MDNTSPEITGLKWGEIKTGDGNTYKDARCYPGGSCPWDWNETGTHHKPGIQISDIEWLINKGTEVFVLSQGVFSRLKIAHETIDFLEKHHLEYYILPTKKAVKKYNQIRRTKPVGGLFHSTC